MKETARIASLFEKLYAGSPWIDVNIQDTLAPLTADQAVRRVIPSLNTIWEIVNHLVSWRENVLRRIQGEVITTPADNYFSLISNTSPAAWKRTLKRLAASQDKWLRLLSDWQRADFEKIYPNNHMTYYEHIQGILQHDAYHLGQIVLFAKLVQQKS